MPAPVVSLPPADPRLAAFMAALAEGNFTISGTVVALWNSYSERADSSKAPQTPDEQFLADVANTLYSGHSPAATDEVAQAVHWLRHAALTETLHHTDQYGFPSLTSAFRYKGLQAVHAEPHPTLLRLPVNEFNGHFEVDCHLPAPGIRAHLGDALFCRRGEPAERAFLRCPLPLLTGYRNVGHSIEALGRLHRFSKQGEGQMTFGGWYSSDGWGRELAAAQVAGLVQYLGESANGMGGVSPNYRLTAAGKRFVIADTRLASLFEHFNQIDQHTAWLEGPAGRVPFDTGTGAVLGQLVSPTEQTPLYVDVATHPVTAGASYAMDELSYYGCDDTYWPAMPACNP